MAERKQRHIKGTVRSLLLFAHIPSTFWGETVLTSVYLINPIPSKVISGISYHEKLFGMKPDYFPLIVFGCTCFILLHKTQYLKLSTRSILCDFLGYGDGRKGYLCYDCNAQKLYISHHVVFLEHIPF